MPASARSTARTPRVCNKRWRPTLHGLAARYAHATGMDLPRVQCEPAKAGVALGRILDLNPADSANEEDLTSGRI